MVIHSHPIRVAVPAVVRIADGVFRSPQKGSQNFSKFLAMQVTTSALNAFYEFGPFRLHPQKRVLLRSGEPVSLTPKVFDTLLVLLQNSGQPISRDELIQAVWPDSFVEEGNLTQNIFVLRKALGSENRYIVTIPGRGYQFVETVREVEESPEAPGVETEPQVEIESPSTPAASQRKSRFTLAWALVTLGLLALAAGGSLLLYRDHPSPLGAHATLVPPAVATVPARRSLAVLGFRNSSGRSEDQWISTAFSEMLNTELAAGNQLRLVSGEDVAWARLESPLPDVASLSKPSLQRLRGQLGADLVVLGSYAALPAKDGERIRFDVRLQDTNTGETLAVQSATGSKGELFQLVTKLGAQLREEVGIAGLSQEEGRQVRASLDANPEATRLYAQGLDALRRFDAQDARDLLQKAIAADPGYALAHSALAQSWSVLGYDLKARSEAKTAFDLSGHSNRRDQLLVEGHYRELNRELPAAIEIYRTLWNFFPDDLEYGLRLAAVQSESDRGKDALLAVRRLHNLPAPENRDPRIDLAEAKAAESISDFARTLQATSAAATKAEAQGSRLILAEALRQQGYVYERLGRPADAIAAFERARTLWAAAGNQYGVASALHMIALAQYYRGDFQAASQSFEGALQVFRRIGAQEGVASCSHNYSMLLHDQGKLQKAKEYLDTAFRIQRSLSDERGVAADLDDIGNVLLGMGDLSGAARVKQQSVQAFHHLDNRMGEAIALTNLGEVLFAQGELSAANQKFQESLALKQQIGYKAGLGYCWMDLANLMLARDRLGEARTLTLQAIALRQQLSNEFDTAVSRLQLAQIALEQGNAAEAESLARSAAVVFDKRKAADSGAISYAVLSRALLAQDKTKEAQAASDQAMALSRHGGDREGGFQALLAAAAVKAVQGRTAESEQLLKTLYSQASRSGYVPYELESRLRLGELELKSGGKNGRQQLADLQRDAQTRGFLLIARQAQVALHSGSVTN
jgi:DNA-binding winged helix-turn-helix (wHTH) protein/tetratricopeptide (TPR) repeat protein